MRYQGLLLANSGVSDRDLIIRDLSNFILLTLTPLPALQYIDQIMRSIKSQDKTIAELSGERARQVELQREHQMWQAKMEYMR